MIIETGVVLLANLRQRSSQIESVLFGYSKERIALIALLAILCIAAIYALVRAVLRQAGKKSAFDQLLSNERVVWGGLFISLVGGFLLFLVIIQEADWFGGFLPLYRALKPTILWLLLVMLQTFAFLLVWYGLRFTGAFSGNSMHKINHSISVLIGLFIVLVLIKYMWVLPTGFGLLKRYGESKYILMGTVFTEGITITSYNNPIIFHYPPLYPITISFALLVEKYAFTVMKVINAVLSTSIIFPVFLTAKQLLDRKTSLLIAFLSGLIPFQFLFPTRILSENLYVPLFLWCVYFVFALPEDAQYRLLWDILTGLFIGLLYLTRYITLALVPVFLLLWWLKPFSRVRKFFNLDLKKVLHLLLMIVVISAVYAPWVVMGQKAGLTFMETLGFGITSETGSAQLTIANLLEWVLLYGAYLVLMVSPFLPLLLTLAKGNFKIKERRWLVIAGALTSMLLVAIVRHSWRAYYNADLPSRVMGRYIIFLMPVFIITAFLGLKQADRDADRILPRFVGSTLTVSLLVVILSYLVLIKEAIIPVKAGLVTAFAAYDAYYIKLLGGWFWVLIGVLYLSAGVFLINGEVKYRRSITAAGLALFFLAGLPHYMQVQVNMQYYEQIGAVAAEMIAACTEESGDEQKFTVYLPASISASDRARIDWTIRIHNLNITTVYETYNAGEAGKILEKAGVIVLPSAYDTADLATGQLLVSVNDHLVVLTAACR